MAEVIDGSFSSEYLDWRRLRRSVNESGGDPAGVFIYLSKLLEGDRWRHLEDSDGNRFERFEDFIGHGLSMDKSELSSLLAVRGATERGGLLVEDKDLFDRVRREVDRLWKSDVPAANGHGRPNKGSATTLTDSGKTADGITARLKRDDPELAEKVIHGEITANAAAHQKGWRKPRVILTSPESLAKQIGKHWTPEQIAQTINALTELLHEDPHKLAQPVKGLRAGQPNEQATT